MSEKAIELTDVGFADAIKSGVTLVDFWAPWCGPCQMQGPIVDRVAEKVRGKARVAKLNVEQGQMVASEYGVRSIPTLMIFKDGETVTQLVGTQPETTLVSAIEAAL